MIIDQFNMAIASGAGIAAKRLHVALRQLGVQSRYRYVQKKGPETEKEDYHQIHWSSEKATRTTRFIAKLRSRFRRLKQKLALHRALSRRPEGLDLFTSPLQASATRFDPADHNSDVIHLHWISWMIDFPSFFAAIPDDFPIVWTLHDMNTFTGGCHYSGSCQEFHSGCGNCPQLGRSGPNDLSSRFFAVKEQALQGKNLHIVTPSRWLENQVRSSRILSGVKSIQTIHNGLDVDDIFTPQDKAVARAKLGLPTDRPIIAFGADSLANRRKGFAQLLAALRQMRLKKRVLGLLFGGGSLPDDRQGLPKLKSTGFITDPRRQALVYSAADVFIMPSLEDNLPQTGIEAMACGTPVIAFETGGVPDYVRYGETGLLAEVGNAKQLAKHIDNLLERPSEIRRLGAGGRELIRREMHHLGQAQKYIDLYRNLTQQYRHDSRLEAA